MEQWLTPDGPRRDDAAADAVLGVARDARALADHAQRTLFSAAVDWARLHTTTVASDAATWPGTDRELSLGGPGCPLIVESAVYEFGAALGLSIEAARSLLSDALEVSHRLPDLWGALQAGRVVVWRVRRIAERTQILGQNAAWYVDRHLTPVANRAGVAQIERAVAQAQSLYDCGRLQDRQLDAADSRGVWVGDEVSVGGTVDVRAVLDLADAFDFDQAVSQGARLLGRLGSLEPLDVRRAQAVGDLARRQLMLDLTGCDPEGHSVSVPARPATQIYLHLRQPEPPTLPWVTVPEVRDPWQRLSVPDAPSTVFEVGNGRGSCIDLETLIGWCERPGARVRITPVLTLDGHEATDGYAPTEHMLQAVALRDEGCVFPGCTRRARPLDHRLDCDHIEPHARGGPTCLCNLACLCRSHHRAKTHFGWSYERLDDGSWLWRSPLGRRYRVRDGLTTELETHTMVPSCADPPAY